MSHTSLTYDPAFSTEDPRTVRALFYGLGSDGTVGANKNSIKIIGTETDNYAQGYFVYDSKKSGSMTTSHLRFGPTPIHSTYLISKASFVACHNFSFLEKMDVLEAAMPGAVFLLNSPYSAEEVWDHLPKTIAGGDSAQEDRVLRDRRLHGGAGHRHGHAHQHHHADVLLRHQRRAAARGGDCADQEGDQEDLRQERGEAVVEKNFAAVDHALAHLEKVAVPRAISSEFDIAGSLSAKAPRFVRDVLGQIASGKGDLLPVSALPAGGTFPTGTAQWEKRNIAQFIPVWDKELCIQCGKCVMVCPHAVIRAKVYSAVPGQPTRRRHLRGPSPSGGAWSRNATRCRLRRRTAPDAGCAWKCAR